MAFTPQGEYFGSGGGDGRIFVWKANLDIENAGSAAKQSQKVGEAISDRVATTKLIRLT